MSGFAHTPLNEHAKLAENLDTLRNKTGHHDNYEYDEALERTRRRAPLDPHTENFKRCKFRESPSFLHER